MSETLNPYNVFPNKLKPGDCLGYKVIAVIGHDHTWTAYRGLTDWSDFEVSETGDKLTEEAASALFYAPPAAGFIYRE